MQPTHSHGALCFQRRQRYLVTLALPSFIIAQQHLCKKVKFTQESPDPKSTLPGEVGKRTTYTPAPAVDPAWLTQSTSPHKDNTEAKGWKSTVKCFILIVVPFWNFSSIYVSYGLNYGINQCESVTTILAPPPIRIKLVFHPRFRPYPSNAHHQCRGESEEIKEEVSKHISCPRSLNWALNSFLINEKRFSKSEAHQYVYWAGQKLSGFFCNILYVLC